MGGGGGVEGKGNEGIMRERTQTSERRVLKCVECVEWGTL